jgi:uncharacterized OsmC-like protein
LIINKFIGKIVLNDETHAGMVDIIEREIKLEGDLTDEERIKLLEIANKCPVHKTLLNEIVIKTSLTE